MHMDPVLYKAAGEGNIEAFKENEQHLDRLVTPIKNTILHIHITSPLSVKSSTKFVEQILDFCPSLLLQVNAKGETPLHVAAKCGNSVMVEVLMARAKAEPHEELESGVGDGATCRQMLRMRDNEGNTALHEAVRNDYLAVVKLLTKEDPDFSYPANDCFETPLYIAAEQGSYKIVAEILETCTSVAHQGPDGKTALHAAVISNDLGTTRKILEKKRMLTKETDQYGWTPIHYAAYYGNFLSVQLLLSVDLSAAYIAERDRKMTVLHMAACQGHLNVMRKILLYCPDCHQQVDIRGWNVLHFAMVSLSVKQLNHLLKEYLLVDHNLMNRKDVKGNTPLHVFAACRPDSFPRFIKEIRDGKHVAVNKQNDSVQDILLHGSSELKQEILELSKVLDSGPYRRGVIRVHGKWDNGFVARVDKAKESHLVVATLIATVTFSAAFAVPGGFKREKQDDQGTAILLRNAAFQAFIITDAIAMTLSLTAVFVHFIMSSNPCDFPYLFKYAFSLTLFAMGTMVIAFVTGTHALLAPSIGLALAICLIGLSFFILVLRVLIRIGSEDYN